jgi:endoglucanase
MKIHALFLLAFLCFGMVPQAHAASTDSTLLERLKGRILLQVEDHGEAWYVNPADNKRYYLADGEAAYTFMREEGLGISNKDLAKIPSVSNPALALKRASVCAKYPLASTQKGKILLQVEAHGEAWYVYPETCYRVYLKDGDTAYSVMRSLSLGIKNSDLKGIPISLVKDVLSGEVTIPSSGTSTSPEKEVEKEVEKEETVTVSSVPSSAIFKNATFFVDPSSQANKQVASWSTSRPADALTLKKIASQPTAKWFGDWSGDIKGAVDSYVTKVTANGNVPTVVAYNIPNRDCGSYSAGGAKDSNAYSTWIKNFADGIGNRKAVVILEPDATATKCVTDSRLGLMKEAVKLLKAKPNVAVYIDAGHDNWIPAKTMAERLTKAGVSQADGFALNVANFYTNAENTTYGTAVSKLVNDKHFIIDTSRNGNGWNGEWCNPTGRKIGVYPTTNTGNPLIDAFLWVKPPGESDGTCNGGPAAGHFWGDYALKLLK